MKQILPELGKRKNATNEKARRLLGWAPRSNEESIVASAESLLRLGLLKESTQKLHPVEHWRVSTGPSLAPPWFRST